ncbi:MAG: sulfatase [Planctomycetota bacterium]
MESRPPPAAPVPPGEFNLPPERDIPPPVPRPRARRNVIGIACDSWRVDHLGCYGNSWVKTPNIDRLAAESAVFDRCYPECLPTLPVRTSWFTGRYIFPFRGWGRLEPSDVLLAEVLWNQGYHSALISDTYHMHRPTMAYERGFDHVEFIRGQEMDPYVVDDVPVDLERYHKPGPNDADTVKMLRQYLKNRHWWKTDADCGAARVARAAVDWLKTRHARDSQRKNFFLWVDMFDPHEPWDPMPPFDRMYADPAYKGKDIIFPIAGPADYLAPAELDHVRRLYAGKCTQTDKWVGHLLDAIRTEPGLLDETLLVWTTDHGECFGEHGFVKKARPFPYVEEVHVPFLVRHPDGLGAGKRFDAFTQAPDLMPTILDFLNVTPPPCLHGASLLPILSGEKASLRDFCVVARHGRAWRIHDREWCFIHYFIDRPDELYRVREDRFERNNVIAAHPDVAARYESTLRKFAEGLR